jgi:hypothetical protein
MKVCPKRPHPWTTLTAIALAFTLAHCLTPAPVTPPPGPVTVCDRACVSLRKAQCQEGNASSTGVTCEQVCERASKPGPGPKLNAACVAEAAGRFDIAACGVACKPALDAVAAE